MASSKAGNPETDTAAPKKKGRGLLIMLLAVPVLLGGAGGATYVFMPQLFGKGSQEAAHKEPVAPPVAAGPVFVDLPEMAVTLPNGGQPRQVRIRISLELVKTTPNGPPPAEVLSPKVYDGLLTYLRTLTDTEVDSSLAIDRIRGDLYRRITLILGPDVVREVLITSLVVA